MALVQGIGISKSFDQGVTYVFTEINFQIDEGKHIALVGANGSGKSTLMKIIAGVEDAAGEVHVKRGVRIGYQMQEPVFDAKVQVRAVLEECFAEIRELEGRIRAAEVLMAELEGDALTAVLVEYGQLQERFEAFGGYSYEQEMIKVATGLGLSEADLERSAVSLSGGEKSKLLLACQLLERPDILLLDEPTNHLDVESIEWLEGFLQDYVGTFVVVSHDRYFLDRVAREVWELERTAFYEYGGNYSQYLEEKERRLKNQWLEYAKQQREIKSLTEHAEDQRSNAAKSEWQANFKDGDVAFYKRKASKVMKRARVAEAKREKLLTSKRVEKPFELQDIRIKFPVEVEARGVILHVKELAMAFAEGRSLFAGINFSLDAQSRMGIIGPNGSGKTTLLKIILGELEQAAGEVIKSGRLRVGYYSQEQETLIEERSALENILDTCPTDETTARTMLGVLRIEKEKVHVPVRYLSGGEKSKVQLCKILLSGANLLILDEPTNHLDIDCREAVEQALRQYRGAIIFVSHDRYFIQKMAQQVLYLNGAESRVHMGDYRSFREKVSRVEEMQVTPEQMVYQTRLAALIGQISVLGEGQDAKKEQLEGEIRALKASFRYDSSGQG